MKGMMKYIMIIAGMVFMSAFARAQSTPWVAPSSADDIANPFANNEDATKKGKKLYNQLCNICHGDKGKGDGMAGAALTPKPANFTSDKVQSQSDGAIYWKMTEGRAPMAAYKDILKEEQRWQLVNYIRTLKAK
jgi:mono/diheme cytochrome c family protein